MWDRVTESARRAMHGATEYAQQLGHEEVDTIHLLLGLCDETNSMAANALTGCGVTLLQVRQKAIALAEAGEPLTQPPVSLTESGRAAIFRADSESRAEGSTSIDSCHFLSALIAEESGPGIKCLTQLGLNAEVVRRAMSEVRAKDDNLRLDE